ncbi:DUF3326 domain-containing protein [candidate division KSB1 bacterium]|nr:DUF3326 domain-containing protein [candidate division KSB1 bacterium]
MILEEKQIIIPKTPDNQDLLEYISNKTIEQLGSNEIPNRFVISLTDDNGYFCELGTLVNNENYPVSQNNSIFNFNKREFENTQQFNAVLLIPTGIGAKFGGHCGDGNAVARYIASACDELITHPNVVNASDINEMTENTLYVEGSIITRLMMGQIGLKKVRSNRILMLMDKHEEELFNNEIINAVSSARISLGIDCDVYEMDHIIKSVSAYSNSGRAIGRVEHLERLFEIINKFADQYDAIGLSTFIEVPKCYHTDYFKDIEMINPWGGIEAMLTHSIAEEFRVPCAHSPMMVSREIMDLDVGIVDPRKAPETSSVTYLHCILKGLHKSPKIVSYDKGLNVEDISCLIIPDGCIGLPTLAAMEHGIPVIAVKENKNYMLNNLEDLPFQPGKLFIVENYLEAVGIMHAIKAGIKLETIRRPIPRTKILNDEENGIINNKEIKNSTVKSSVKNTFE